MSKRCHDESMFAVHVGGNRFRHACVGHVATVLMDVVRGGEGTEVWLASGDENGATPQCEEVDR